jgi:arylsulfatase A-like enzyme
MIMRWRGGLEGGRQIDDLVHGTDWLPTLSGICGVERPGGRPLDGRDALAVLRGEGDEAPARFWQLNQHQPVGWINAAMREGPWKLVRPSLAMRPKSDEDRRFMDRYVEMDIKYKYHPDEVTELMDDPDPEYIIPPPVDPELYHIDDDPQEKNNLAATEPERASRMLGALEDWFAEVEAERRRIQPDGSILELE